MLLYHRLGPRLNIFWTNDGRSTKFITEYNSSVSDTEIIFGAIGIGLCEKRRALFR